MDGAGTVCPERAAVPALFSLQCRVGGFAGGNTIPQKRKARFGVLAD